MSLLLLSDAPDIGPIGAVGFASVSFPATGLTLGGSGNGLSSAVFSVAAQSASRFSTVGAVSWAVTITGTYAVLAGTVGNSSMQTSVNGATRGSVGDGHSASVFNAVGVSGKLVSAGGVAGVLFTARGITGITPTWGSIIMMPAQDTIEVGS